MEAVRANAMTFIECMQASKLCRDVSELHSL
jgi:hypothetical protein